MNNSSAHADNILNMLKQADADNKHLFIILTGKSGSEKSIAEIIRNEYPTFTCSSNIEARDIYGYTKDGYIKSWLSTQQWGDGLAMITYERGEDVSNAPSLLYMLGHDFYGFMYRQLCHDIEPVTPCHILCVMDEESFTKFNSQHIRGKSSELYLELINVYNLDV